MSSGELQDFSALAFAGSAPTATAIFKQTPADFQVDEEFGFAFDGKGEHVCLQLQKTGLTTTELAGQLARRFALSPVDVGYAGMKDRQAVTRQWFSLRRPHGTELAVEKLDLPSVQLLDVQRNSRKIQIGSHRANRFVIRLRQVSDPKAELGDRLQRLAREGAPNYFGPQRFGAGLSTVVQAFQLLREKATPLPRQRRSLLYSAARSWLFNQVLSERVTQGSWNLALDGEVFSLDGTPRFFTGTGAPGGDDNLAQRLAALDIHPTGPLPGQQSAKDRYRPGATVQELEQACLAPWQDIIAGLAARQVEAGRRALRLRVRDLEVQRPQADELLLSFRLGSGGYATSVLRELCRASQAHTDAAAGDQTTEIYGRDAQE